MSDKIKYFSEESFRYFISKITNLISSKADKSRATNYSDGLLSYDDYAMIHNLKTSNIVDFPTTMPPSSHSHTDLESSIASVTSTLTGEINTLSSNLSDNYYAKDETDDVVKQTTDNINSSLSNIRDEINEVSTKIDDVSNNLSDNYYTKEESDKTSTELLSYTNAVSKESLSRYVELIADIASVSEEIDTKLRNLNENIRFENGSVIIGNTLQITPEGNTVAFYQSGKKIAYTSGDEFVFNKGKVAEQFDIGGYTFIKRDNDNLSFKLTNRG